jgi:hypothetical protein
VPDRASSPLIGERARSPDLSLPLASPPEAPRRRELAWAAGLIAALTAAMYVPFAFRGGFITDDWALVSQFHFQPQPVSDALVGPFEHLTNYRPFVGLWLPLLARAIGTDPRVGLLLCAVAVAVECVSFYLVLRLVGLRSAPAGCAAALLVVLPSLDGSRLWVSTIFQTGAVAVYLGGVLLALRGLRAQSGRVAAAYHGGALLLYAFACLSYEGLIPLVAAAGLVYAGAAGIRGAARRWPADLILTALLVWQVAGPGQKGRGGSIDPGHLVDRAGEMWRAAVEVVRFSLPFDRVLWGPLGLLVIVAAAVGIGMALARGGRLARAVRAWAAIALGGMVFALLGLLMFLPATTGFVPVWQGPANRISLIAGLGESIFLIGLVWLCALGLASLLKRPGLATLLGAAAVLLLGVTLLRQEIVNQDSWATAHRASRRVISAVRTTLGKRIAPGTQVVTFRHPLGTPDSVPVFITAWDLKGALDLAYDDQTIRAHAAVPGMRCDPAGIAFPDFGGPPDRVVAMPYRSVWFVDVEHHSAEPISGQAQCLAASARLRT